MSYDKQTWANGVAGGTPIDAENLNHIEDGIESAHDLVEGLAETKADATDIAGKADTATVNAALALKADSTTVALKADTSTVNAALALKADTSTVNTALASKADSTTVTAALALKADTATMTTALAGKAATTHTHTITDLPAGTTITVLKSGGTWPARPSSRTDVVVAWKGADPSPTIVSSGTAGMLDNVDYRLVTP